MSLWVSLLYYQVLGRPLHGSFLLVLWSLQYLLGGLNLLSGLDFAISSGLAATAAQISPLLSWLLCFLIGLHWMEAVYLVLATQFRNEHFQFPFQLLVRLPFFKYAF